MDNLGKGLTSLYEGVLKIPRFVYGVAAAPQNALADALDMPSIATNYDAFLKTVQLPGIEGVSPLTMLDQAADYYKGEAQNYEAKTRKYDENIFQSVKNGKFKDAGNQILDQITESAPSIAAMAMTSGAGSAANLGTVTKTLANGLPFMSQKNAEIQDDPSIPEWKKPLVSGFYGLAEVMLDQKYGTQAAIEGVVNRFANEGAEVALEAGKDLVSSYIKKALKATSKAAKPFIEGAAEEASTQFAQNMLDKYALGKDVGLMDGVADAAIVGGAMTGGINTAGSVASKILQPKAKTQVSELEGQQVQLLNELGNDNLTPEARKGVEQMLETNQANIESIAKETQDAIAKLNPEQKKQAEGISEKITAAEAVVNDPNASEEVKKVAEAQIESLGKEIEAIKPEPVVSKTGSTESTPVKKGTDVAIDDTVELVNGKTGKVTNIEGDQITMTMEDGATFMATPDLVEMSVVKPKEAVQETQTPVEVKEPVKEKEVIVEPKIESNETKQPVPEKENVVTEIVPQEKPKEVNEPKYKSVDYDNKTIVDSKGNELKFTTKKDGSGFTINVNDDSGTLTLNNIKGDKSVGSLRVIKLGNGNYIAQGTSVNEQARRSGLASAMYDIIENEYGITITESDDQTQDAKGFWDNRKKAKTQKASETKVLNEPNKENPEKSTALKNADIAEKRAELGFEEREKVPVLKNKTLVEQANKMIKDGFDIQSLIDDVLDGKREAKPEEVIILKEYQLAKEQELIDLSQNIVDSQNNSPVVQDRLEVERDQILQDIDRAYQAGEKTGTVSARALQARKVQLINDYSLANMLIQKRKANGGEKLSSEQINETTEKYNEIKNENDKLIKKIEELEAANKDLKSGKALKGLKSVIAYEERQNKRTQSRETIDKQIDDALDSFRKNLKKQAGTLSMNAIPSDLIADVARLGKLYAQKGVNTLEGIADRIYNDLKGDIPDLTREDIQDVIENYDYEAESKEESRLKAFKNRTAKKIEELEGRTENKDFSQRKAEPLELDAEAKEIQARLRKARYDWELALERDLLDKRTRLQKIRDFSADLLNVPRQLMATLDLSAPLRQGLVLTVNNPKIASKTFVEMLRQTWSQERFDNWYDDLIESPGYPIMKESGLYIANQRRASLQVREEQFMSNLVEKIPVIGKLAKGSERAYVGYLNKLRADVFTQGAIAFENEGKTLENSKPLYEALATYVNAATGRGDLGKIENSAQILNSLFFSPRLIASRVRLLTNWANPVWYANTPKEVRYMYAKDMSRLIIFGTTILGLAALGGADVEKDPRSSDFGKIKVGDKRWDIWGGFQQFVRFFAQIGLAQRKSTTDKTIREINGEGFKGETRADLMLNMVRSKLAPVPATLWNLAAGSNLVGDEYTWKDVPQSFLPLFATDLVKATAKDGATGLLGSSVGAFGVGVQDYDKGKDARPLTDAQLKSAIKKAQEDLKRKRNSR